MNWKNAIKDFQHYLKIERGLADNSIKNYSWDIEKLMLFLKDNNLEVAPEKISKETVQQFIYEVAKSVNPRSPSADYFGTQKLFQLPGF